MIVVVIIGILAAIAIPIFMNQQKSAIAASVKSDIKSTITNVATALAKYPTATGVYGNNPDGLKGKIKINGVNWATGDTVTEFDIVVSNPQTEVVVVGNWQTWRSYATNSQLGTSTEFNVTYDSRVGKAEVVGNY